MASLEERFIDLNQPGALTNPDKFARAQHKSLAIVKKALKNVKAYREHAQVRKNFKRRPYVFTGVDEIWGMDLAAVPHPKSNYNKHWVLCCVDGLSKMCFLEALKSKHADEVIRGFKSIMNRTGRNPKKLEFDHAKEFLSNKLKAFCKGNGIEMFTIRGLQKISTIERLIQTVFRIIERYKTQYNTKRFVHKLRLIEKNYNDSYHRSIKTVPSSVNKSNEMEVFDELYRKHYPKNRSKKEVELTLNSAVLKKVDKKLFEKGRTPTFHPTPHFIEAIKNTKPITYILREEDGNVLTRPYYRRELFPI
jgi:Integrase core domain